MKVVVTGATGHLGRYTVQRLVERGQDVLALSRAGALPEPPFGAAPALVRAEACDVTRDSDVERLAAHLGKDVVLVHLAAWHPPSTATTGPAERARLLETNVLGTMRVLDAARCAPGGVQAVIYASSFEVYGVPEQAGAVSESARLNPVSDYGATKLAGEDHLFAFAYEEKSRAVALRFPAVYGPGESTPRALPNFLRSVAGGRWPQIHGDGADLRDQIHARDAALAIECAISSGASGFYNVADGEPHSIRELAETALRVAGMSGPPELLPRQKSRMDFHMNIDKARAELGFRPMVTLEDGMREQLAWLRATA
ncbi:MAG TPA: NAD(P)-dependent oxidoreductase [Polyangiaceae bacterium]